MGEHLGGRADGRSLSRRALLAAGLGLVGSAAFAGRPASAAAATADMPRWFDRRFGAWVAGDVPRAYDLGNDRTLWITNDSYLTDDRAVTAVGDASFQRNAAFVERDGRLGLIHSPFEPFLANGGGSHFDQWFWFHGSVRVGDRIEAFVSLMRRTGPLGWAINFEYADTWIASISTRDGSIIDLRPAPNRGTKPLYGFSVASDDEWTYLFGNNAFYDSGSLPNFVARVPFGEVDQAPRYWDGRRWVASASDAASIYDGVPGAQGLACRLHVFRWRDEWWASHKWNEFFGAEIHLLRAPAPSGPWTVVERVPVTPRTGDARSCTYDAQARPIDLRTIQLWWSNNAYAETDVQADASRYRPKFESIQLPE